MATIIFDTLKFVEKPKAAGMPESQAKAEAEALQEALGTGKWQPSVISIVLKISCVK
jgi:hypothetical protein